MTDALFLSGFAFGISFLSLVLLLRNHMQRPNGPGVTVTVIEEPSDDLRL